MLKKILIIQTAFPGDVILATALMESLHHAMPEAELDILVRQGNESLFKGHPFIKKVWVWNKTKNKFHHLRKILFSIREEQYDLLVNLQRFASSGLLTLFSAAKETRGFDKNPFSIFFSKRFRHVIGDGRHEIARNNDLIADLSPGNSRHPRLYPTQEDLQITDKYKQQPYICIAPGSVWFTKKFPEIKWIDFIREYLTLNKNENVYLIGSAAEKDLCERILISCNDTKVRNLAGKLSFLQSATLMKDAEMNYVNDSAPMHMASAVSGKTTAIFCSTVPAFGFGPLTPGSRIVEITEKLSCRPCGIHGFKKCPQGHFKCALQIEINQLLP